VPEQQKDCRTVRFHRCGSAAKSLAERIFSQPAVGVSRFKVQGSRFRVQPPFRAFVSGTAFQVRVWRALLAVPPGSLISYGDLASAIGHPSAARAVGAAVGRNSLAYLVPCHRVIRETGVVGDSRWGNVRKRAMLAWESR